MNAFDALNTCPTCHGWSCMTCVDAVYHEKCYMDCPTCDDRRNAEEEAWVRETEMLELGEALDITNSVTRMCDQMLAGFLR